MFYTKMNDVQVKLHEYERIPNATKETKTAAATAVQDAWKEAADIVQNLRELRDTLLNKESEAVYNYEMNDGVWENGKTLEDIDQHIADRQLRLDSARQLALQSEQQQRRQIKVKWLYVILFIVLIGAAAYMYMWAVGDEIGLHNAESVEEAVEAPEPNEADQSPSVLQTMGESLGVSDKPAEETDVSPSAPPATAEEGNDDTQGSIDNIFTNSDDSRQSSSSSDSMFS